MVEAPGRPPGHDQRPRNMRLGIGFIAAVLAMAETAAAQTSADPPRRLRLDTATTDAAPAPATRERDPWDWASSLDVTATCPTCPRAGRPAATNGNAPWLWGTRIRIGDDTDWLAAGVVGQRNVQRPLYMTEAVGGLPQADAPTSTTPLGDTRTTWQLVLQGERTLWRSLHGVTTGVVGEAFLPLGAWGKAPRSTTAPAASPRAARGAFRVRF
jgi:hypothetical protein